MTSVLSFGSQSPLHFVRSRICCEFAVGLGRGYRGSVSVFAKHIA